MSRFGFAINNLKERCRAACSDVTVLLRVSFSSRYAHSRHCIYNKCASNTISFDFDRDLLRRRSQIPFFKALSGNIFWQQLFSLFCFFLYRDFRSRSGEEIVYILFSLVFPKFFKKNWISHECFHRVYVLIRYIEVSSAINNAPAYRLFITFSSITRQLRQYKSWKQR